MKDEKVVYADKEVTDFLDLLLKYWNITKDCDCSDLMTYRETNDYLKIKDEIEEELS